MPQKHTFKKIRMTDTTTPSPGNYVDFSINNEKKHLKITSFNVDCMRAQCLETGTQYLFYKTNGFWCLALQSVVFSNPSAVDVEKEKHSYWTRY